MVGDGAVGKSALVLAALTGETPTDDIPSVIDIDAVEVEVRGRTWSVALWDTRGVGPRLPETALPSADGCRPGVLFRHLA